MFRRSIQSLALGAVAAVAAASAATAHPCCACAPVVCEQFYIVNHGPVYSGPGIVVAPAYFELDRWPANYPYIGRTYLYQPYDGPYADPYRQRRHRSVHHMRAPRQLVAPPLDPSDK
jgi:hypothetical protein